MNELILKGILEGLGLGVLLVLVCAVGIRKGAVGMVHLYSNEVQERCVRAGLTTHERIKRNSIIFKLCCLPGYIAYVAYLRIRGERRARISCGLLAVARYPVCHESYRPLSC